MPESNLRLALYSTLAVLAVFALAFGALFGWRKYQEYKMKRGCIIRVTRSGDIHVDGRRIDIKDLDEYLIKRARASRDWNGKIRATSPEYRQPFPLRVVSDDDCLYDNVQQIIDSALRTEIITRIIFSAPRGEETSIYFGPYVPKEAGRVYIDASLVRVKLLWYSPDGKPRYTGNDGKVVLKIRYKVFGEPGRPDWAAFERHLRKEYEERMWNLADERDLTPIMLDGRKYVPMKYVLKTLRIIHKVGFGEKDIFLAAPEIPY